MTNIYKTAVTPQFEIHENIQTGFRSLFAIQDVAPEVVLSEIDYETILTTPDMYSVQKSENQHIVLKPAYLKFINHSCKPNVFFDLNKMEIQTLRKIKSGEEIVFFYPSTEWKMTIPFDCSCGNNNCLTHIEGALNLTFDAFSKYKFSDYVIQKATACLAK